MRPRQTCRIPGRRVRTRVSVRHAQATFDLRAMECHHAGFEGGDRHVPFILKSLLLRHGTCRGWARSSEDLFPSSSQVQSQPWNWSVLPAPTQHRISQHVRFSLDVLFLAVVEETTCSVTILGLVKNTEIAGYIFVLAQHTPLYGKHPIFSPPQTILPFFDTSSATSLLNSLLLTVSQFSWLTLTRMNASSSSGIRMGGLYQSDMGPSAGGRWGKS